MLGIILGLVIIAAMEAFLHFSLHSSIQSCIDRECELVGLPPGCPEREFECTEWSGLSIFVYRVVGIVETVILLVTVLVGYIIRKVRNSDNG